ncbi:MAG: tautomerase family protein [Acidobacteriota bacterium]|nr:tautomerase family protein [Acidobacteriota bacterium]
MPHIVVYSPRLTREKKVACAKELTEAFERGSGISAEHLVIHFEEHSYDNVAVGGKLLTDMEPTLAERERQYREQGH